jgi:protein gp37
VSAEPLLGRLDGIDLTDVHWLIIGGESGPRARRLHPDWVRHLLTAASTTGTSAFVKQLGTAWTGTGKGGDPTTWPPDLRVRTYPTPAPRSMGGDGA